MRCRPHANPRCLRIARALLRNSQLPAMDLAALERELSAYPPPTTALDQLLPEYPLPAAPEVFAGWAIRPAVPVVGVAAYLLAKVVLVRVCAALGTTGRSAGFTAFCFLHNVAIGLFSLVRTPAQPPPPSAAPAPASWLRRC